MKWKVCWFYGIRPWEFGKLLKSEVAEAWLAMTQIEAQQMLNQVRVTMFPHMKNEARRNSHKELMKLGYPEKFENENKPLTLDQITARLGGLKK